MKHTFEIYIYEKHLATRQFATTKSNMIIICLEAPGKRPSILELISYFKTLIITSSSTD